jgi:hypothetical protein
VKSSKKRFVDVVGSLLEHWVIVMKSHLDAQTTVVRYLDHVRLMSKARPCFRDRQSWGPPDSEDRWVQGTKKCVEPGLGFQYRLIRLDWSIVLWVCRRLLQLRPYRAERQREGYLDLRKWVVEGWKRPVCNEAMTRPK